MADVEQLREQVARIVAGAMQRALAMAPLDMRAWSFTEGKTADAIHALYADTIGKLQGEVERHRKRADFEGDANDKASSEATRYKCQLLRIAALAGVSSSWTEAEQLDAAEAQVTALQGEVERQKDVCSTHYDLEQHWNREYHKMKLEVERLRVSAQKFLAIVDQEGKTLFICDRCGVMTDDFRVALSAPTPGVGEGEVSKSPERFAPGRAADGEPERGCIECDWGEHVCHCGGDQ